MNLHILQHVQFEGPANIEKWAKENGHSLSYTKHFEGTELPNSEEVEFLVIMGGPMSVNDVDSTPWMQKEIKFIQSIIESNKPVIGICLGAQFIAKALGAKAYKGSNKEIGWMPVQFTGDNLPTELKPLFPDTIQTFHWHSDTFDIPDNAKHIAKSEGTQNQAFVYNNIVWGLQFHLEMNSNSIAAMLEHCSEDLTNDNYVQSDPQITQGTEYEEQNYSLLSNLLNYLSGRIC